MLYMKRNRPLNFGHALKQYKRYRRRYANLLKDDNAKTERLEFLKKRILKLKEFLQSIIQKKQLAGAMGSLGVILMGATASAQNFVGPETNPFGLVNVGTQSNPTMADIDGDGDMDLMAGDYNGNFTYYENTGTATVPVFGAPSTNPFGLININRASSVSFGDLDNDGDLDILAGEYGSTTLYYFQNTGTNIAPAFTAPVQPAFGIADSYYSWTPSLVDIDGDMDLDIVSGEYYGEFIYIENVGTASSPSFAPLVLNPFGLSNGGYGNTPRFADLDGDGDFDMISGNHYSGDFRYYENTGTANAPAFASLLNNPFGLSSVGLEYSVAEFVDIDNDGDMDIIAGEYGGDFFYFNNCGTPAVPVSTTSEANLYVCTTGSATLSAAGAGNISWYDAISGGNFLAAGGSFTTPTLASNATYYAQDSTSCDVKRVAIDVTVTTPADPTITIAVKPPVPVNVAFGGTASASSTYTSNSPEEAFNGDTVVTGWGSASGSFPAWLEYDFGTGNGKTIVQYSIYSSSSMVGGWGSTGYLNTDWSFEGYNGTDWDTLDLQVNVMSTQQDMWFHYPVSNTQSYERYRVHISNSQGGSYAEITELQLLEMPYDTCSVKVFDATVNVNANPASYQWMVNGTNAGTDSASIMMTNHSPGDQVSCVVTSSGGCTVTTNTATSNTVTVVGGSKYVTDNYSACFGDSVMVGSTYFLGDTTFMTVGPLVNGCDSVVTSVIVFDAPLDLTTSLSGNTITANATGATYKWIDCSTGSVIANETSASYTPASIGDYKAVVTVGSCSDTTACVSVIGVGIDDLSFESKLSIYPNPSNGNFTVKGAIEGTFAIMNGLGQTVRSFTLNSDNNYVINVEGLTQGVYFISNLSDGKLTNQKLIITN